MNLHKSGQIAQLRNALAAVPLPRRETAQTSGGGAVRKPGQAEPGPGGSVCTESGEPAVGVNTMVGAIATELAGAANSTTGTDDAAGAPGAAGRAATDTGATNNSYARTAADNPEPETGADATAATTVPGAEADASPGTAATKTAEAGAARDGSESVEAEDP